MHAMRFMGLWLTIRSELEYDQGHRILYRRPHKMTACPQGQANFTMRYGQINGMRLALFKHLCHMGKSA